MATAGVSTIKYAGQMFTEHMYRVQTALEDSWTSGELVPERFLTALEDDREKNQHSNGLLKHQKDAPKFWVQFNTFNEGAGGGARAKSPPRKDEVSIVALRHLAMEYSKVKVGNRL